ncbi:iron-sulfur cluster assembly protein, partial [Brevibacterium paucivorans]
MTEVIDSPSNASAEEVTEALLDVVDPELGVNVVDLGLVYGVVVEEDGTAV